jgi:hypothetical protein
MRLLVLLLAAAGASPGASAPAADVPISRAVAAVDAGVPARLVFSQADLSSCWADGDTSTCVLQGEGVGHGLGSVLRSGECARARGLLVAVAHTDARGAAAIAAPR